MIWGHLTITQVLMLRSPVVYLQRQKPGTSQLRVRSLGRSYPHRAEPSKGLYSQVKINQVLSCLSPEPPEASRKNYFGDKQRQRAKRKTRTPILEYFVARGQPSEKLAPHSIKSGLCASGSQTPWICSKVFQLTAHLRKRHIHSSSQRTLTNNFSRAMTSKQSKFTRHTRKQDNLNINKNYLNSQTTETVPHLFQILELSDPYLFLKIYDGHIERNDKHESLCMEYKTIQSNMAYLRKKWNSKMEKCKNQKI